MIEVSRCRSHPSSTQQAEKLFEGLHGAARTHDARHRRRLLREGRLGSTLPSERELILIRAADVLESVRAEVVDLLID
jgi:hypothetical protein